MHLTIDPALCTGCRICEVFCSFQHEGCVRPSRSRIWVGRLETAGDFAVVTCRQCAEAFCAEACPEGALARRPDTCAIVLDEARCVGCQLCLDACPYGSIIWDAEKGLPLKCDLCQGRPECAHMCPTGAVVVGDAAESTADRAT